MRGGAWPLALGLAAAGCASPPSGGDGGAPPPHVALALDQARVIDEQLAGTVTVTGCDAVARVRLLQAGAALGEVAADGGTARFALGADRLAGLWPQLGLAAALTLSAEATCRDGRAATSPAVGASFFPVAARIGPPAGTAQTLPDAFLAEGGTGGRAVGFVGCVGTDRGGTALALTGTRGEVLALDDQLPYPCSASTVLSERVASTGVRWVLEPGLGAYAVDGALRVLKRRDGALRRMGVSPATGTAVFWDDDLTQPRVWKVEPVASTAGDWWTGFTGVMNADPVIDLAGRVAWVSAWQAGLGPARGDEVIFAYDLDTGGIRNGTTPGQGPPILLRQLSANGEAVPPAPAALSPDGQAVYLALATGSGAGVRTTVQACVTGSLVGGCLGADRLWTAAGIDGVLSLLVPFAGGATVAAVGPGQAWFLRAADGAALNLGGRPITPSGSLRVLGVQPGRGSDLFLLHGPVRGGVAGWPTEAVAVDAPAAGELYRFGFGTGESAASGLTVGVDEAGQAWFRVGPDLVKPLPLATYRGLRGLTPP